jgi:hypothetical protein
LIHRRAKLQRLLAGLAMLAMGLMIFVPLLSRALVAFSTIPVMTMADGMVMPGMAPHQANLAFGQRNRGAPHDPAPPSTDACGYCSLLFHSPALAATVPVLPPALPPAATPLQSGAFRVLALRLPAQRSRGPPLA